MLPKMGDRDQLTVGRNCVAHSTSVGTSSSRFDALVATVVGENDPSGKLSSQAVAATTGSDPMMTGMAATSGGVVQTAAGG